jgi:hypothetical protein
MQIYIQKMSIVKDILEGKYKEPGVYNISNALPYTPQERLMILQQLYNAMEYLANDAMNRLRLKCYYEEIMEILKYNPNLKNEVKLKNYDIYENKH